MISSGGPCSCWIKMTRRRTSNRRFEGRVPPAENSKTKQQAPKPRTHRREGATAGSGILSEFHARRVRHPAGKRGGVNLAGLGSGFHALRLTEPRRCRARVKVPRGGQTDCGDGLRGKTSNGRRSSADPTGDMPALIPAFSPEEKGNGSAGGWREAWLGWLDG